VLGNLPEESTSFVGRTWELFRLDRALEKHRLITLAGSGGVGKSRLALRAARRAERRFPDGVAWAELSPLQGERLLLATVSDACDLNDHTPRMQVDALCEWLARRRLLLVLDSCEHLIGPCRALVGDLLTAVPGLTVLATSREPLGLDGERVVDVEPFPADGGDALELFSQRLAAVRSGPASGRPEEEEGAAGVREPGADPAAEAATGTAAPAEAAGRSVRSAADRAGEAAVDDRAGAPQDARETGDTDRADDDAAAAVICRRLEGFPLALELAAGQAGRTGVAEVAARLGSRLEVLQAPPGAPVHPERHRTMRTAIGWSHELCAPPERLLWARLTVFRGDFDERAARDVCAGGPLLPQLVGPLLDRLVAVSVLRVVPPDDGSVVRYRMLDTIREYGALWLRALGEVATMADRHAAYWLRFAEHAERDWLGSEQGDWYRSIGRSHNDICAALDHFLAHAPRRALRLAGLLGFVWSCCGHLHEARDYLSQALEGAPEPGPDRTRALWALGVTISIQGEYETARRVSEECRRSAASDGGYGAGTGGGRPGPGQRDGRAALTGGDAHDGRLSAAYLTALLALLTGVPLRAEEAAREALATAGGSAFDSPARLRCHLVRIFALTGLGRLAEAGERAQALRRGCSVRGESWTRAYLDYQLSLIALLTGRPGESEARARSMLEGKQGLGDSFGIALGLDVLAAAIAASGDGERAGRVYGTGHAFWSTIGHPQRGTPELKVMREMCERSARAGAGDEAYERAFRTGATSDPYTGLRAALSLGGG
jgi:predicted ATPase